jgi:hypothetical protein
MQSILEKELEKQACKIAVELGAFTFKFASPNQRGVPDRIFIGTKGVIFVEFKRPGGKLRKLQEFIIKRINKYSQNEIAFVCDNLDEFRIIISKIL